MKEKVYYLCQDGWTKDDFYCLHRYLHKMIFYYHKRMDEIKALDLSLMSLETKTIIFCLIKYYNHDFLLELDNLKALKNTKPLEKPLIIDGDTARDNDVYKELNIIF